MGLFSLIFGSKREPLENISEEEERELFISLDYMDEVSNSNIVAEDITTGLSGLMLSVIGLGGVEHILELMHSLSDLSDGLLSPVLRHEMNAALKELALKPRPHILGNREGIYIRRWVRRTRKENVNDPTLAVRNPAAFKALGGSSSPSRKMKM